MQSTTDYSALNAQSLTYLQTHCLPLPADYAIPEVPILLNTVHIDRNTGTVRQTHTLTSACLPKLAARCYLPTYLRPSMLATSTNLPFQHAHMSWHLCSMSNCAAMRPVNQYLTSPARQSQSPAFNSSLWTQQLMAQNPCQTRPRVAKALIMKLIEGAPLAFVAMHTRVHIGLAACHMYALILLHLWITLSLLSIVSHFQQQHVHSCWRALAAPLSKWRFVQWMCVAASGTAVLAAQCMCSICNMLSSATNASSSCNYAQIAETLQTMIRMLIGKRKKI